MIRDRRAVLRRITAIAVALLAATSRPQLSAADPIACAERAALPSPPAHFPSTHEPATNPSTPAGVALGRRLFFDPRLSSTGRVSCASCHAPAHGYGTPEPLPARGASGQPLVRHPPALVNLAWADTGLFWDGGAKNLESAALAPLTHEDELGRSIELESLLEELRRDPGYVSCFDAAFGTKTPTIGLVLRALAQFQRSLVFADSRWDRAQRGELKLSADERAGERVFRTHCARCHQPPLFTDGGFHNNGLDASFPHAPLAHGRGRARVTRKEEDLGKFKTPSLRNVGHSAPYMHDGRLRTLAAVITHYRRGMQRSPTLDAELARHAGQPGLPLSDADSRQLEAFLRSLDEPNGAAATGR